MILISPPWFGPEKVNDSLSPETTPGVESSENCSVLDPSQSSLETSPPVIGCDFINRHSLPISSCGSIFEHCESNDNFEPRPVLSGMILGELKIGISAGDSKKGLV